MGKTITLENGKEITISEESYKALEEGAKKILVPDNIELVCDHGYRGIKISEHQLLFYSHNHDTWVVKAWSSIKPTKCELVKVKKEDRIAGRVYFATDLETYLHSHLGDIGEYGLYIGNDMFATFSNGNIYTANWDCYEGWYEVRKVND